RPSGLPPRSMRRMFDLIIIGAGHAGLSASQVATAAGLEHLVLERGDVGESWRSQRWDSFTLNTPSAMNRLPGGAGQDAPEAFEHRDAWVARLERYASAHALPVRTRTAVTSVEQADRGFTVTTETAERLTARNVIVASGSINAPKVPPAAESLDVRIERFAAASYRSPSQLLAGAVLVVGSAQSGVQIAE